MPETRNGKEGGHGGNGGNGGRHRAFADGPGRRTRAISDAVMGNVRGISAWVMGRIRAVPGWVMGRIRLIPAGVTWLNRALAAVAGLFLVAMMALTCGNIVLRLVWLPISGTFELMGFFGAMAAAFGLGYTQIHKGHIAVDVLIRLFSPGVRRVLAAINALLCMVFFGLMARQLLIKASVLRATGEVTETLRVIYHPYVAGAALGCAALALVFLADLIRQAAGNGKGAA